MPARLPNARARLVRRGAPRIAAALVAGALCAIASHAAADPTRLAPPVAYNYGEQETTREAGMAGGTRALGGGTTAMFQNPADLPETRSYHIEGIVQLMPEAARHLYGGAVVDSVTGRLAGGVSLVGGFIDKDGLERSLIDARIALAYPLSDRVFVGLGGRYTKVWEQGLGPFGASKFSGGLVDPSGGRFPLVNTFTFDAGITVKATDSLYIAALGQNLSHPGNALVPTMVGGGIGYGTQDLSVEVDGLADFDSWGKTTARVMVGGEYLAADHFPLRLGYRYDQGANMHWLSGGVGYVGREFSVEGSVRRSLSNPGGTMIVLGIAYFLESAGVGRMPDAD
jgi:hypothetical protein